MFDIKDLYSPISKKLLDDSIYFAWQHVHIKKEDFNIVQHARKSLLYNKEIPWQKKNTNLFEVAMGAYDGAEVCEIVGLFLLSDLGNKFDKNSFGLYRDDGVALFKNINVRRTDKIRKEFHQLCKENGLSLEIALRKKYPYSELFWSAFSRTYAVSLRIQSECGKIWTRIAPNTDTFYAALIAT